jgi:DNA topoisomerase VI subunit B
LAKVDGQESSYRDATRLSLIAPYIDVRVEHEGDRYVHIIVQDSGSGISAEHMDQIFPRKEEAA